MPKTILSVDGDAAVGFSRNDVLREAGFEVIEARAGADTLKLAFEQLPALIVLAIELPGIDGFSVCKRLKADPRTASIPVLHIAGPGESHGGDRESLESGAEACLQEPVEPPVLIAVATALIRACSVRAAAGKPGREAFAEGRLSALIESIPDEVWFADTQGRITLANPPALREFKTGAPTPAVVEELLRALAGETVRNQQESIRTPVHGELRYRQVSASPVRDAAGNIVGSVSVVHDITGRKRAEQTLRASEERSRALFETMTEGFTLNEIVCDEAGKPCDLRYLAVNPAFERQTGLKAGDILGRTTRELFPDAEPVWFERYGKVALTGEPARFEEWFGPLGRWFEVSAFQTEPGKFGVVFTDITERKRADEERQRLASEFGNRVGELQAVLDAAPVAVWIAHDPQCLRITGNTFADQVVMQTGQGGNISASAPPGDAAVSYKAFRGGIELRPEDLPAQVATATGQPTKQEELDLVFPGGRTVHMLLGAVPLFDAEGRVRGSVAAGADITARKRAEEALRESEAVLRGFFDSPGMMRGFVELVDGAIVHVSCNAAAAEMYGVDRESIAGKSAADAGAPEEIVRPWIALYEESRRTGKPVSMEYARRDADGQERWLLATASYLGTGHSGNPRFAYTILDLTERRRAEEALAESESRLRTLGDNLPEGAIYRYRHDVNGEPHVDFISAGIERLTGVPAAEFMGEAATVLRWIVPEDLDRMNAAIALSRERLTRFEVEVRHRHRTTGEVHWSLLRSTPSRWPDGSTVWDGIELDITERKQAEEALRESEKIHRAIGESIDYGVWVCAPDGRNTYASESFLRLVGLTQEQCSSFGWGDVLHPDDAERTIAAWKECVRTEGQWDIEHRFRGVDGKWHPILARGVPVRDEQGRVTCWAGINLDIGALKRTQEVLRESESRERARAVELEALMDATPAAIFITHDSACRSMSGNRMAYALLRTPPEGNLSKSAPDSEEPTIFRLMKDGIEIPPPELPVQKAASTGQTVRNYALDVVFEDGVSLNLLGDAVPLLDEDGRPRGAVGVLSDVTELKRGEKRLRDAQKLESLGLLAGGVAHDFNNLLVGVIGNASLAREMLPPDHPTAELLDAVLKTGEQAAHLTRQMLAYSGKGKFVVEALDLSALIPDMSGLLRPSIPKKVTVQLDLEEDLPPIEADRGQVQQVFMNLALNAAEAIGSQEGLITVRTGVQDVDERYIQLHPETAALPPGKYIRLEVRDNGCGMDEATKARIFDPFFSTKFTGRGLGLAAVAGIVRGHKGAITVSSAPGHGSCFTVLFPKAGRAAVESAVPARSAAFQGTGTVLVVDDEQIVREMAKKSLERHGYTVLLADSGLAAIDVFRRHPGEIALVVLDLSMPHMNGEETLPELRKIRPEVKVVVSSGYTESEAMPLFHGQRVCGFVQKPYTSKGIAEKVRACLR